MLFPQMNYNKSESDESVNVLQETEGKGYLVVHEVGKPFWDKFVEAYLHVEICKSLCIFSCMCILFSPSISNHVVEWCDVNEYAHVFKFIQGTIKVEIFDISDEMLCIFCTEKTVSDF